MRRENFCTNILTFDQLIGRRIKKFKSQIDEKDSFFVNATHELITRGMMHGDGQMIVDDFHQPPRMIMEIDNWCQMTIVRYEHDYVCDVENIDKTANIAMYTDRSFEVLYRKYYPPEVRFENDSKMGIQRIIWKRHLSEKVDII